MIIFNVFPLVPYFEHSFLLFRSIFIHIYSSFLFVLLFSWRLSDAHFLPFHYYFYFFVIYFLPEFLLSLLLSIIFSFIYPFKSLAFISLNHILFSLISLHFFLSSLYFLCFSLVYQFFFLLFFLFILIFSPYSLLFSFSFTQYTYVNIKPYILCLIHFIFLTFFVFFHYLLLFLSSLSHSLMIYLPLIWFESCFFFNFRLFTITFS